MVAAGAKQPLIAIEHFSFHSGLIGLFVKPTHANHPVPLHTQFRAIVDGISGNTYLKPVNAKLRESSFTASGAVINIKGHGHPIDLDVDVPDAQLQDFLDLTVKTEPAIMTAIINTKTKLQIRPGKESVSKKLRLDGAFTLRAIHFTNPKVQDKVDMLSLRAQGEPKKAKPGAKDVNSQMMTGRFHMDRGVLHFSNLEYVLPGARVDLEGVYSLNGQLFDFHGKVLTKTHRSRIWSTRGGNLCCYNRYLSSSKERGKGAEIPVRISGTRSEPKFGLDLFGNHSAEPHP